MLRFRGLLFLLLVLPKAASSASSSSSSRISSRMQPHHRQQAGVPGSSLVTHTVEDSFPASATTSEALQRGYLTLLEDVDDDEEAIEVPSTMVTRGGAASSNKDAVANSLLQRLKIGFYFGLWYALNIVYNIVNKKVLNVLPAPLMVGTIQFGVGALYVAILWALRLREKPTLTDAKARRTVRTVGFWHCVGQLSAMISLGAGPVSFTHIVKALEPFFSAIVAALYFGKWMHPAVYTALLPVVGGVGYACLKEKSFSWLAFGAAMGSNVAFALRAVLSKIAMTPDDKGKNSLGTHLTSSNLFGLVTCAAFWISIPLALATEGSSFFQSAGVTINPDSLAPVPLPSLWDSAVSASDRGSQGLVQSIIVSGLFHYLNNEVMYLALSNVHPVTLAVGNTMKRVVIMVASVMVFQNQISLQVGIGSAVGISGVLLYSLTKQHYENLEKQQSNTRGNKKPAKASLKRNAPGIPKAAGRK